jgi:hypothetical protein
MRSNFRSSASARAFSSGVMTSIWACDGGMASNAVQWLDLTVWQPTRATKQIAQNVNLRRYIGIGKTPWICYVSAMDDTPDVKAILLRAVEDIGPVCPAELWEAMQWSGLSMKDLDRAFHVALSRGELRIDRNLQIARGLTA